MSYKGQLIDAIKSRDNRKVSDILKKINVEEVNEKNGRGEKALVVACREGNNPAVSFLLAKPGIDVNVKEEGGWTPLYASVKRDNQDAVAQILDTPGINVNIKISVGLTPLHEAVERGNWQIVAQLLNKPGIDVNVKDSRSRGGWTPLHVAAARNNQQIVEQFLACPGIDMNAKDNNSNTPIMNAAKGCRKEVLNVLLEDPRVDIDVKENGGRELETFVGLWNRNSNDKKKCLDMIKEARFKRQNGRENPKQENEEEIIGIGIEKIEKINKKIKDGEQRWKENVDHRNFKRKELDERHNLEVEQLEKEIERLVLNKEKLVKKHRDEKSEMKKTFDREDEANERYMASLKEIRMDLAQDIKKITYEPSNDTSHDDKAKLEAARETLECPICMESMQPPSRIWMCRSSHIICETCKDRLIRLKGGPHPPCPTCKSERISQRAIIAEKFAASVFNK